MQLTRHQSKTLVAVMVGMILGLSVLATFLITRGWSNETVQEQVEAQESERRQQMPRFSPADAPAREAAPDSLR